MRLPTQGCRPSCIQHKSERLSIFKLTLPRALLIASVGIGIGLSQNARSQGIDPSTGIPISNELQAIACGYVNTSAPGYVTTITCGPDPAFTYILSDHLQLPWITTPPGMLTVIQQIGIRETITETGPGYSITNYNDGGYREVIGTIPSNQSNTVNQVSSDFNAAKNSISNLGNGFLNLVSQPLPPEPSGFSQPVKDAAAAVAAGFSTAESVLGGLGSSVGLGGLPKTLADGVAAGISQISNLPTPAALLAGAALLAITIPSFGTLTTAAEAAGAAGWTLGLMSTIAGGLAYSAQLIHNDPPDPNYQSFISSARPQVSASTLTNLGANAGLIAAFVNAATDLEADIRNLVNDSQKGAGAVIAGDTSYQNLYSIDFRSQEVLAAKDRQELLAAFGALSTVLSSDPNYGGDIEAALAPYLTVLNDPSLAYILSPDFVMYTPADPGSGPAPSSVPEPPSLAIIASLLMVFVACRADRIGARPHVVEPRSKALTRRSLEGEVELGRSVWG